MSGVDVDAYIKANINDPAKIADAMAKHNVDLARVQSASGYTTQQMTDYINNSGNAALKTALGNWKPATQTATTVSDVDIDGYIKANINDPAKIAAAMDKYNVGLERIQNATGYTRDQMVDYIAKSNNASLKGKLASWTPATPTGAGPAGTVTDAQIDGYLKAHINDPAKIAADMKLYNVDLDRVQKATGYTREQMTNYIASSGNAELKAAGANWKTVVASPVTGSPAPTGVDIDGYIRANINDPAKIAAAMHAYNVDLDRIQHAAGYTTKQMTDYINNSGNSELKTAMTAWKPANVIPGTPTIILPPTGQVTQLANGYSVDSLGRLKGPGSNLYIATITSTGQFLDVSGKPLSPALTQQYSALFGNTPTTTSGTTTGTTTGTTKTNTTQTTTTTQTATSSVPTTAITVLNGMPLNQYKQMEAELKARLPGLEAISTAAYDKLTVCLKAAGNNKEACAAELKAFDAARQPTNDTRAALAAVQSHLTDLEPVSKSLPPAAAKVASLEDRIRAANEASEAAYQSMFMCAQTRITRGGDCAAQQANYQHEQERLASLQQDLKDAQGALVAEKASGKAVSDTQINDYIRANINDPDKIAAAMKDYNVGLDRLAAATGYTHEQIADYITKSHNGYLANELKEAKWTGSTPVTITLPAAGKTKELRDGFTVDSNGVVRNAKGQIVIKLTDDGKLLDPSGKPVAADLYSMYVSLFNSTSSSSGTGQGSDAKGTTTIATGAASYGGDNNRDRGEDVKNVKAAITNAQVKEYINTHLKDPNAIANAMKQYGVGLQQIQDATGYSRAEMTDYINKSGNTQLKTDLANWREPTPISATRTSTGITSNPYTSGVVTTDNGGVTQQTGNSGTTQQTVDTGGTKAYTPTNNEINDYVRGNLNSPQAISSAMSQYNVSLDQIQKATGYSRAEMEQYIKDSNDPALKASLENWK